MSYNKFEKKILTLLRNSAWKSERKLCKEIGNEDYHLETLNALSALLDYGLIEIVQEEKQVKSLYQRNRYRAV